MVYNFKDHNEMSLIIQTFIISIADVERVDEISVEDINNFLNDYEDWKDNE
jgi:hypothetical protein